MGPVAGAAASPPPGPGPAAGGCAFGRLRSSASQANRPHPCKLGRRLLVCAVLRTRQDRGWASCPTRPRHASGPCGSRPRNRTHPAFDRSPRSAVDPRHAWMNLHRNRIFRMGIEKHPRMAWIYCVDQGRHLPTAAEICQRWGGAGVRGVSRMDAAAKPTWTYLRRPRTPTPPHHPTEYPLLLLLWPLQVQGAALPTHPNPRPGSPRSASVHRSARDAACPSASAAPATVHPPGCPATGPAGCAPASADPTAGR